MNMKFMNVKLLNLRRLFGSLLVSSFVGFCASVGADEKVKDVYDDEFSIYNLTLQQLYQIKTVTIATGTETSIKKAPAVASVITREDIDKMAANTLGEVLENVIGIYSHPSALNRLDDRFSIRGIYSGNLPHTLVLIDGVKQTHAYTGGIWSKFSIGLDLVERIEVVRGPGSAIFGADAFAGIINIVTRDFDSEKGVSLGVNTGSFKSNSTWLSVNHQSGELKAIFNAQWRKSAGDNSRIIESDAATFYHQIGVFDDISLAPGPLKTNIESLDVQLKLAYEDYQLSMKLLDNNGGTGYGAGWALSDTDVTDVRAFTTEIMKSWQLDDGWNGEISAYYQSYDEYAHFVIWPPGFRMATATDEQTGEILASTLFIDGFIGEPTFYDNYFGSQIVANYEGYKQHKWRFEVGFRRENQVADENKNFGPGILDGSETVVDGTVTNLRGTPYIFIEDNSRQVYYLSMQDQWQFDQDWMLTIGARYDKYSDFGNTFNPRVALVWQASNKLTTKLLYGQAFRPPSFSELYVMNNPVVVGNDALQAEKMKMLEYTLDYHLSDSWQFNLGLFSYTADKMIDFMPVVDGPNPAMNLNKQTGKGVEFETLFKYGSDWYATIAYAWQDIRDNATDNFIADVPKQSAKFSFNWRVSEGLDWRLDGHWTASRHRGITDERLPIDDYIWANTSLQYQVNEQLTLKLLIRNLFNTDARAPSHFTIDNDFPLGQRGAWLNVKYQF